MWKLELLITFAVLIFICGIFLSVQSILLARRSRKEVERERLALEEQKLETEWDSQFHNIQARKTKGVR